MRREMRVACLDFDTGRRGLARRALSLVASDAMHQDDQDGALRARPAEETSRRETDQEE